MTSTLTRRTDAHALARLHSEHGKALYGFLLGLTFGDRQRAEDLLQETLFRAWTHPEALESAHASVRPWLYTVGKRLAIDARRARQVRPAEVGPDALEHSCGRRRPHRGGRHLPGPARSPAVAQPRAPRRAGADLLPRSLRLRGRPGARSSPGTVKSRTYYALRALRAAMPGYGPGAPSGRAAA